MKIPNEWITLLIFFPWAVGVVLNINHSQYWSCCSSVQICIVKLKSFAQWGIITCCFLIMNIMIRSEQCAQAEQSQNWFQTCDVSHWGTLRAVKAVQGYISFSSSVKLLLVFLTIWQIKFIGGSYLMRALLAASCCFCWSSADGGLGDGMEEDGGRVEERRDEERIEEEGAVWLEFFPFRRRRRDLTLIGWTRLWLLRRWATLRTGPVPVLLKGCSDLETKS